MCLFVDKRCVARSFQGHQSKERVKMKMGFFPKFLLRSPKVINRRLTTENPQNRPYVPFCGQTMHCMNFSMAPIERARQNEDGVFPKFRLRSLKVTNRRLTTEILTRSFDWCPLNIRATHRLSTKRYIRSILRVFGS